MSTEPEKGTDVLEGLRRGLRLFERLDTLARGDKPPMTDEEAAIELDWFRQFARSLAADIDLVLDPAFTPEQCQRELERRTKQDRLAYERAKAEREREQC
jgi:hypothetical protein